MRPRKRDFRGDTRKGAKNYDTVSSDDSEVYRRKDPFAGRNRKRPSGRRAQLNICNPSLRFGKPPFFIHRSLVIYVLVNSLVLAFERTLSATLLFDIDIACANAYLTSIVIRQLTYFYTLSSGTEILIRRAEYYIYQVVAASKERCLFGQTEKAQNSAVRRAEGGDRHVGFERIIRKS